MNIKSKNHTGVGLNLRLSYLDQIIDQKPNIDFWEVIAENFFDQSRYVELLQEISKHYPIHIHCVGHNIAGIDKLDQSYFQKINELISKINPRVVSDHLCFQKHGSRSHFDLLPFPLNKQSLEHCKNRLSQIQEFYGREVYIENLSYYIEFKTSNIKQIDFLQELVDSCRTKMLLDLNNIEVNTTNLGHRDLNQFEDIDPKLIGEFHLSGVSASRQPVIDDHAANASDQSIEFIKKNKLFDQIPVCYERDENVPTFNQLIEYVNALKTQLERES